MIASELQRKTEIAKKHFFKTGTPTVAGPSCGCYTIRESLNAEKLGDCFE
jgi:hypothetical protein